MTILQLKYFMEAAKCGNFTSAARTLYISQPSVTKQIGDLENELGFRLFSRKARGVELTEPGELLYQSLRRCQNDFGSALRQASQMSFAGNRLIIGMQSMIETYALSSAAHAFCDKCGITEVITKRLPLLDLLPALERHELDCAIMIDTAVPEDGPLTFCRLIPARDYVLASKNNRLVCPEQLSRETLRNVKIAMERPLNAMYASPFGPQKEICVNQGFLEQNVVFCDNFESALSLVEHSDTVMIVDEMTIFPNMDNYRFIDTGRQHYICLAWRREEHLPLVDDLVAYLCAQFPCDEA